MLNFEQRRSLRRRCARGGALPTSGGDLRKPGKSWSMSQFQTACPQGVHSIRAPKLHTQTQAKGLALDVAMKLGLT